MCPLRPGTLHDFRSHEIADQLTLLDAELFYKIEVQLLLCVNPLQCLRTLIVFGHRAPTQSFPPPVFPSDSRGTALGQGAE